MDLSKLNTALEVFKNVLFGLKVTVGEGAAVTNALAQLVSEINTVIKAVEELESSTTSTLS